MKSLKEITSTEITTTNESIYDITKVIKQIGDVGKATQTDVFLYLKDNKGFDKLTTKLILSYYNII